MCRSLLMLLLALVAVVPLAQAATIAPAPITVAETKALLRIASKLSGLPAKRAVPVVAEGPARFRQRRITALDRFYPAADQSYDDALYTALGVTRGRGLLHKALVTSQVQQALYDPLTRKVYVARGRESRATILQQLVHALQDQSFDLRRLRALTGSRDARLAASAAVAGHASLVAQLPSTRTSSSHGGPRLDRFLELENGFPTTVGVRFAVNLRNLGGNKAVFGALRRFPETTEQIFHIDKFLEREPAVPIVLPVDAAGLTLGGDDTFGELDVRALLAIFDVPRLDHVGKGWGGGRSAIYRSGAREAAVLALDWDSELDARQWAEAVRVYVNEAFDADEPGLPEPTPCTATACWNLDGHAVAFERVGTRTTLVLGTDVDTSAQLARAILGEA